MEVVSTAALEEARTIGGTQGVLWALDGQLTRLIAHISLAYTKTIAISDVYLFPGSVAPRTIHFLWQNHGIQLTEPLKRSVTDVDNGIEGEVYH